MVFRRPRVNVKPNVQATRPVSNIGKSLDTSVESVSNQSQEEQSTQEIDPSVASSVIEESVAEVEKTTETPVPSSTSHPIAPPSVPSPIPITSPSVPVSSPVVPPSASTPLSSLPSSPAPTTSIPTSNPIARPLIRRKIAPNFGIKTPTHHRRPSASCSGTESETEQSRQKHVTASSITFGRITQSIPQPVNSHELQSNVSLDLPINGDISAPTKAETMITEVSEVHSPIIDNHHAQLTSLSTRMNTKISHEYITQHITYRAQRLAAKVEPDMTIRKRRAATLRKLDETGASKDGAFDTSKFKIADFAHFNPDANHMKVQAKTTIQSTDDPTNSTRKQSISSTDEPNLNLAPQLKIDANGALVVDEESLYIRNADDTQRNVVIIEGKFNDDNLTHRSYRKIGRRKRWNGRDTLRFYQALRMCGTDFTTIARVFPNRDRDDIKRKFKTEDKANRTLVDSALSQRIPFDLTCFYSPSEDSTEDENGSDMENGVQKKTRKRRMVKRKPRQTSSSDPLEINRRRERRLQAKKNSMRVKKSVEFINDDDDDEEVEEDNSMDVADTIEVMTTAIESKSEQVIPSNQNEENSEDNTLTNMTDLENLLGNIDGGHLLFVHNTDETTGLDRIDVHVVMPNTTDNNNEQFI